MADKNCLSSNENMPVVVQQPCYNTLLQEPYPKRPWQSGVCDCKQNVPGCCLGFFGGRLYRGMMAQRMGEHFCLGFCLAGIWPMRSVFRERHHIEGSICNDFFVATFCGPCATCQLAREMDKLHYEQNC